MMSDNRGEEMDTELHLERDHSAVDGYQSLDFSQPIVQLLPEQQTHLELLSHLASYSELLIAVVGPAGVGKSTLAQSLSAQREEPEDTLMLHADLMMGLPAVLNSIASCWDLPQLPESLAEAKEAIRRAALARAEEARSLLVIIDQAEQLDIDTLNDIAHIALLAPQSLSFALFGAPGFESGFREGPTLAPVHVLRLEPMTSEGAAIMADQVFGAGAVSDDQIAFAFNRSEGLPLIFLRELEDLLLSSAATQPEAALKRGKFPLTHILAVTAVAAALVLSFLYQDKSPELSPEQQLLATLEDDSAAAANEHFDDSQSTELTLSTPVVVDGSAEPVGGEQPAEIPDFNYPAAASSTTTDESVDRSARSFDRAPQSDVRPQSITDKVSAAEANLAMQQAGQDLPSSATATANTITTTSTGIATATGATSTPYSPDERALMAASGYVAQLLGSHSEQGAQAFIQRWQGQLSGKLYLYQTRHNGKDWHVVVSGVYPDRAAAQRAVAAMPRSLRDQTPWIKDVQTVKKILSDRT